MRLILYSKPGCHLCEGLQEKLEQIQNLSQNLSFELEVRDITTREDWFGAYEYEVPVLFLSNRLRTASRREDAKDAEGGRLSEEPLPRPSPRASVQQLEQMLRKYFAN
jgi:glutaredoxin